MVARPQSLHDYLRNQLSRLDLEPPTHWFCERIILRLDRNGYLPIRLDVRYSSDAERIAKSHSKTGSELQQLVLTPVA